MNDDLKNAIGTPDETFNAKYESTVARLQLDTTTPKRHSRVRLAVLTAAICILLIGTAYAATLAVQYFTTDKADLGASWVMLPVREDYTKSSVGAETTVATSYTRDDNTDGETETHHYDATQFAIGVYTDGEVSFIVGNDMFDPSEEYYYEMNRELYYISYYRFSQGTSQEVLDTFGNGIYTVTVEMYEDPNTGLTDSYDEATALLGTDFKLPSVYTDDFNEPTFRYQSATSSNGGRDAVYVTYSGEPGIYYFAETVRDDGEPHDWYVPGATIEQTEFEDTTLYRITNTDVIRYTWSHDGLVYMLFTNPDNTNEFTEEQVLEIIQSMLS